MKAVTKEAMELLAAKLPPIEAPTEAGTVNGPTTDIGPILAEIGFGPGKDWHGQGTIYTGDCPFNPNHRPNKAYFIQFKSGAMAAGCQHDSCSDKKWPEFRDVFGLTITKASPQPTAGGWKEPEPFFVYDCETFPVDALPSPYREIVEGLAEQLQVPVDIPAMVVLGCLSAALQDKAVVRLGPNYEETLNLYIVVVSPSGTRKSPVVKVLLKPLQEYERKRTERMKPDNAERLSEIRVLEGKIKKQETLLSKSDESTQEDAEELSALIRQREELEQPRYYRLLAEDSTAEKYATLMADNEGYLAVVSSEGDLFEIMFGRYTGDGKGPNVGIFIKAYDAEEYRVDRMGRESVYIPRAVLTICVTVQPVVLQSMNDQTYLKGKGLLARFALALPKSNVGFRNTDSTPVPVKLLLDYEEAMLGLLGTDLTDDEQGRPTVHTIELSKKSREVFKEFQAEVERMLRPEAELGRLQDWGNKFPSRVGRIAGLLHMAQFRSEPSKKLQSVTMRAAIKIGRYLADHARVAFDMAGADPNTEGARRILDWILATGRTEFSRREAHRELMCHFAKAKHLDGPLKTLGEKGYIRPLQSDEPKPKGGRPPSPIFAVNPLLNLETEIVQTRYEPIQFECALEPEA